MGGRNGTCAISQLPIPTGTPTRLVLLQEGFYADISESQGRDMMGGAGVLWRPRCIPILGEYDGYGSVVKIDPDHWTCQLALARFRLDIVEQGVGERNEIHQPAVILDEVLNGGERGWTRGHLPGIEWLQKLIFDDRVSIYAPAMFDDEEGQAKHVAACVVREDIYQTLANHFTDDNHGNGRRPEFTHLQVSKDVLRDTITKKVRRDLYDGDTSMDAFIKPRLPGAGRALVENTQEILAEVGKEDLLSNRLADSLESMSRRRMRDPADRFAVDYAHHLLAGGVESTDPVVTSIIEEVATFIHVEIHMELMCKFWHPQSGSQAEGWLSHAALALKTMELVKRHARSEDT